MELSTRISAAHTLFLFRTEAQTTALSVSHSWLRLYCRPVPKARNGKLAGLPIHHKQTLPKEPAIQNTLVIDSSKYAIYVRVLDGHGDGLFVTIDRQGRIQVGGADPGPLRHELQSAAMKLQAAADAFNAAVANQNVAA